MPPPPSNSTSFFKEIWGSLISMLRRIFGPPPVAGAPTPQKPPMEDPFLERLIEAAVAPLAETLGVGRQEASMALMQCRSGEPNELARKSQLRVQCSFKKNSPSRVAVMMSILFLKDGQPIVSTVNLEASWDDLPSEVRSEFIRKNPTEVTYALAETRQPI
jgi:hypothetical protein